MYVSLIHISKAYDRMNILECSILALEESPLSSLHYTGIRYSKYYLSIFALINSFMYNDAS